MPSNKLRWSRGSQWLRWEPHIHTPSTLLNNQFNGDWDTYIHNIEVADPIPVALGITDYFTLRSYKEIQRRRGEGALAAIPFIFPNVEIRLFTQTKDGKAINLHLLVSPGDPNHVQMLEERLSVLQYSFDNQEYPCTDDGLTRLGQAYKRNPHLPDEAAISEGANQFKIALNDLIDWKNRSGWCKQNILFAVAGGKDGIGGISVPSAFATQKEELCRFADVIFSGNPSDRAFWLGHHPGFSSTGYRPKPCLHGSDAHNLEAVLKPSVSRLCWIRGEPSFDSLRQTAHEPERRVHIGEQAPTGPYPGEVIRHVRFQHAPWMKIEEIELNDGLVTIIGARGSGKTALLDLIAYAAQTEDHNFGDASFFRKAEQHIFGMGVEIEWGDGTTSKVSVPRIRDDYENPRIRYLSQQFVDRLCSPEELSEPLVEELEDVVFNAIPDDERMECTTFDELRALRLQVPISKLETERETIRAQTEAISIELQSERSVPSLGARVKELEREQDTLGKAISEIQVDASDVTVQAQKQVAEKLVELQSLIAEQERRKQDLMSLSTALQNQSNKSDILFAQLQSKFTNLLGEGEWQELRLRPGTDVNKVLGQYIETASEAIRRIRVLGVRALNNAKAGKKAEGLAALLAENDRLTKALGLSQQRAKKKAEMEKRLNTVRKNLLNEIRKLEYAQGARGRRQEKNDARYDAYERVLQSIVDEEEALRSLYTPLSERLESDSRLSRLSFYVHREVDMAGWAHRGEDLFDLRKPPFQRTGALLELSVPLLDYAWRQGTPQEARSAMEKFVQSYGSSALNSLIQGRTAVELGEWLYSTDHIRVKYGVKYDGVELENLSPGTRGVVLLTLYLALDVTDVRPLLIDQPEENLDPRSVHEQLVPFFREATARRQIIMVTHNANLVVNADSDQVIIAESRRENVGKLPSLDYEAGGLERESIRTKVCELLEGGAEAFYKRGIRYGVPIP